MEKAKRDQQEGDDAESPFHTLKEKGIETIEEAVKNVTEGVAALVQTERGASSPADKEATSKTQRIDEPKLDWNVPTFCS